MNPILACASCRRRHRLRDKEPGSTFACRCGATLAVPRGMRPKPFPWAGALLAAAFLAVDAYVIGSVAKTDLPELSTLTRGEYVNRTTTVVTAVTDLCKREQAWFAKERGYIAAAPTVSVPAIGFTAPEGPFRFASILLDGDRIECLARGRLDDSGIPWTIAVVAHPTGDPVPVEGDDVPPDLPD